MWADAAADRRRILAAATDPVEATGVSGLSMDEVTAAGVGVGAVYRRFKDRAGLAHGLLDERERELGPVHDRAAPAGPRTAGADRIRAFLHTLIERTDAQLELLLFAETSAPAARFEDSYAVCHRHLSGLPAQLRSDVDAQYLAHALLAVVGADLFAWQRTEQDISVDRMKAGVDVLLDGLPRDRPEQTFTKPNAARMA